MSLQNQGLFTIYSIQTNFFIVSSSWRSVKEDGSNSSSDKFQTCYTLKGNIYNFCTFSTKYKYITTIIVR